MSPDHEGPGGSRPPRTPLARHLLRLIPRTDQRELIREDLNEELERRIEEGHARPRLWYLGAILESVADWWLGTLSWRSARSQLGPRGVGRSRLRSGGWLSDLRFAFRMIRRDKIVSGAVVLTVLLGVSSTAAVAALLRGVLLRPLPYPDAGQIVRLTRASGEEPAPWPVVGLPDLEDWRERSTSLIAVAGWSANAATLTGLGQAERISVALVTSDLDRVLGISPAIGRLFITDDFDVTAGVAILSHSFWTSRFGADPAVLGRTIELDLQAVPVVGVLPRTDLAYPPNVDIWLPLAPAPDSWMRTVRGASWLNGVGRMRAGMTTEVAEQELSRIQRGLVEEFPRENDGQNAVRLERLKDVIVAPARPAIRILTAAIGVVLLLASINVGLLLLARSNRRRQEFAVRAVLGGDRSRLARLILTEALVLTAIGGALGLPLALPLIDAMVSLYPGGLPRATEVRLDGWVVAASFLTICLTGGLASLAPAVGLRKLDLASHLRLRAGTQGRAQTRTRSVLVGTQLAFSAFLLIGATLLSTTLLNLRESDPGFEPNRVLTFRIAPAVDRYPTEAEVTAFYRRLLTELEAIPGVVGAGGVNFLPFSGGDWGGGFRVGGETHEARVRVSWPGYYEALGLRLARGRVFDWRDGAEGAAAAMLNEAAARVAFYGEDPLGRQIEFEGETREIVGILQNVRHHSLVEPPSPEVHVPAAQFSRRSASIVVRTAEVPLAILPAVRQAVTAIDSDIPVTAVATMGERIEQSVAPQRFRATLVTALGGLAAILALIGVYGVMSYAVAQRRREMGIRFALGESGGSIRARVLRSAGALSLAGVGAGAVLAWVASRWLDSLLYEVSAKDPWAFVVVSAALLAAGTASGLGPAIRAGRVDPLTTIREE